jgi:hypothetical protein
VNSFEVVLYKVLAAADAPYIQIHLLPLRLLHLSSDGLGFRLGRAPNV